MSLGKRDKIDLLGIVNDSNFVVPFVVDKSTSMTLAALSKRLASLWARCNCNSSTSLFSILTLYQLQDHVTNRLFRCTHEMYRTAPCGTLVEKQRETSNELLISIISTFYFYLFLFL